MVTASQVKDLREKTGAGMMDCKKALTETDGDMEKAIELLRERGIAKAAKKSGRIAAEGLVEAYISEDGKVGAVVEVNSETDFVAKNEDFKNFVMNVAKQVVEKNPYTFHILIKNRFPEIYDFIFSRTSFLPKNYKISYRIYCVLNGISKPPTCRRTISTRIYRRSWKNSTRSVSR